MQQYTVKQGDTMFDISLKFGITLEALSAANPGVDPARIFPGQVLNIPVK
jgi:LysM repeat protein